MSNTEASNSEIFTVFIYYSFGNSYCWRKSPDSKILKLTLPRSLSRGLLKPSDKLGTLHTKELGFIQKEIMELIMKDLGLTSDYSFEFDVLKNIIKLELNIKFYEIYLSLLS